jgi:hypothetical protein
MNNRLESISALMHVLGIATLAVLAQRDHAHSVASSNGGDPSVTAN